MRRRHSNPGPYRHAYEVISMYGNRPAGHMGYFLTKELAREAQRHTNMTTRVRRTSVTPSLYAKLVAQQGHRRDNPGPYYRDHGKVVTFDSGRRYRVTRATKSQAARYLTRVKKAEHSGRRIPRGPAGMNRSDASVLLHFGPFRKPTKRRAAKRRRTVACQCPVPRKRRGVSAAPKKKPTVRRRPSRAVSGVRPTRRPAPTRATQSAKTRMPDMWDETARIYGTL